jgi:CheY-like chemotaxis protein
MEKNKTILYVDDDADDREMFGYAFNTLELELSLETAVDGFDALDKLATVDKPARIYIDINMPKMNGMELLRIIKSNPVYAAIPAFIFSTTVDPLSAREARRLGAAGVFVKPNSFKGLVDQLSADFSSSKGIEQQRVA